MAKKSLNWLYKVATVARTFFARFSLHGGGDEVEVCRSPFDHPASPARHQEESFIIPSVIIIMWVLIFSFKLCRAELSLAEN